MLHMNLVNQKVMHLKQDFGLGIIVEQDENIVTVKFEHKEHKMKMQYPEAFLNYVKLIDTNLQNQIEVLAKEKIVSENERTALSLKRQREKIVHGNAFKPTHDTLNTSYRPCIAFKLNYCDGGKSDHIVGFNGICSDKIIRLNQMMNRDWCTNPDCECSQYYNGQITRYELDKAWENTRYGNFLCYESAALRDGAFGAGSGKKIKSAGNGHLCIFTTQIPDEQGIMKENYRLVTFMGLIKEVIDSDDGDIVYIDKNHFINFNLSEARQFKFWDIHSNKDKNNTLWGSGLFRYFDDYEAIRFIKKAIEIKKHDSAAAKELLKYYCELHHLSLDDAI